VPAIITLLWGLASSLAFAHPFFWSFPLVTLAVGAWTLASIRRAPDAYTGGNLARVGMIVAVVCGTAAIVSDWRTTTTRRTFGRQTADEFIRRIQAGNPERAFLLEIEPARLKDIDPDNLIETAKLSDPETISGAYTSVLQLAVDANQPARATIRFLGIERDSRERSEDQVSVLYEIDRPRAAPRWILVNTIGRLGKDVGKADDPKQYWYVAGITYPYFRPKGG